MAITGGSTYLNWHVEASFAGSVSDTGKVFGHDQKISAFEAKNNIKRMIGLNNVEAQDLTYGRFEGSLSVDFILADPWIWKFIAANSPVKSGVGPYTYKYIDPAESAPNDALGKSVPSIQIDTGHELGATDVKLLAKGASFKQMSMDFAVGDPVNCKADFDFADLTPSAVLSTPNTVTDQPMTFAHATIEIPDGTTITNPLESMNITINRNTEVRGKLGSRVGAYNVAKPAEYDIKIKKPFLDDTFISYLLDGTPTGSAVSNNPSKIASLDLNFSNGEASTALRSLQLSFSANAVNSHGLPVTYDDVVNEDIDLILTKMTKCIAINNTSAFP